jgi:hypothetical protein
MTPPPNPSKTYEIVHRKNGLFFVCLSCSFEIAVNELPPDRVSKRTRAAAEMKEHERQEHRK